MTEIPATTAKKAKHRSPAYPAINLKKALAHAKTFYDVEKRHAAPVPVAAKHFGYSEKSSGGALAVGALIHFGLMSAEGTGATRLVKLTDLALRVLLDERPDSPEKAAAIKQAALLPKIHAELYKKYGLPLPSDATVRTYLLLERTPAFNETVVNDFIKEYKDTLAFAKIVSGDTLTPSAASGEDTDGGGEENKMEQNPPGVDPGQKTPPGGAGNPPRTGDGVLTLSVPYRGSNLSVRVELKGQLLTRDHVAKVRKYLELVEEDLGGLGDPDA